MKHEFLRRLSALALAVVMAVTLCTPAWAAPVTLGFDTRLIILKDTSDKRELTILGLQKGDIVELTATGGMSVSVTNVAIGDAHEVPGGGYACPVEVNASSAPSSGEITMRVTHTNGRISTPSSCYVYCGEAPFLTMPSEADLNRAGLTAPGTLPITIRVNDHKDLISGEKVTFYSGNPEVATVTPEEAVFDNDVCRVTVTGRNAGSVSIFMQLQGYSFEWKLEVIAASENPVTSVQIAPTYLEMTAKDTHAPLTATVKHKDTTDKKDAVTWYSNNYNVVDVDAVTGEITAISAGRAEIYAKAGGVESNHCIVDVKTAPNSVALNQTTLRLDLTKDDEKSGTLIATPDPVQPGTTYAWRTSNASVADFEGKSTATADRVMVTGKKEGIAVITVTATFTDDKGKKTTANAQCSVTVLDENSRLVNQITLSETSHKMPADGTFNLSVTSFNPSNVLDRTIRWESSDDEIAKLDMVNQTTVKVTSKKAGTARITATAEFGGANQVCEVIVTPVAETITLGSFAYDGNITGTNKYTYTFRDTGNNYFSVNANLGPSGAADPIHWVSQNPAVATVSNTTSTTATVTKVAPGRTKITAVPMDPSGKDRVLDSGPAEITVTVSGVIIVNDASNTISSLTLMEGQYRQIEAQVLGSAAANGDPAVDWISSDPSVVSVSSKNSAATTLTARRAGTAVITATKGTYYAQCSVTVTEDTAGLITSSGTPGVALQFSTLLSQLQAACQTKTNAGLSYITNLSVSSTEQGILHDNHFSSDDTGAGVGIQDRYYPGTAPQGQRSLNDLSFVPRTTFSGTAEINYTAWSTNNQSVNGVIQISVSGTGDVTYSGNAGSPVNFLASDFNRIHSNLRSVSFTPPLESAGVLYYKYTTPSQPGTRVTASSVYNRTGTPNIDDVTFVPAAGYQGAVRISYKGTDTSGRTLSGVVTVNVTNASGSGTNPTDIAYSVQKENWVTFRPSDFSTACRYALGESLSYVRFTQPPSSEGTLFYNYKGFSDFDGTVAPTTSYYYSGTPSLNGVSFVPTTTTPSRVDIPYTGYTTRGNTFTGTVHVSLGSNSGTSLVEQGGLRYTVFTGKTVNFSASDFNAACVAALGRNLASIQFNSLPGTSQGTLRLTRGNSTTPSSVTTGTRFFRTGSSTSNLIGNVFFQASTNYTGTFTIPFTGTSENGTTFTDVVTIMVTPPVSRELTYSGTTANPIRLRSSDMISAANGALDGTLSYITFNNLPGTTAGKLYLNYSGFGTGTVAATSTRYYVSGSPSIDQISFVPRGRCTGQVGVGYTAVNTSGQSVSGRIMFNITSTGNSGYFTDMYNHTWAAPSVDYLYQNGVVKGTTATTFGPSRHIKRGDFVLMLCRAFQFSGANSYSFADVPLNSYYSQAISTAKRLGVISGDGSNFRPESELTRQDAMVMIYNALNAAGWNVAPASASVLSQFSDSGSISAYARNAVSALVQLGAVNGSTSGRMNPRSPITRAEAAVILHFIMTM